MSHDARALRVGWPAGLYALAAVLSLVSVPASLLLAPLFIDEPSELLSPLVVTLGVDALLGFVTGSILLARVRRLQQGTYGALRLYVGASATVLYALSATTVAAILNRALSELSVAELTLILAGRDATNPLSATWEAAQTASLAQGTYGALDAFGIAAISLWVVRSLSLSVVWSLLSERTRERFWYVVDSCLVAALIFVLWTQDIRPPEDVVDRAPYVASFLVCFVCAWRALARAIPFLLDSIERVDFQSLVAARLLRARKSGFLTIIGGLSIGAVSFSSCALTTTMSVMGGFREDLRSKILGNHAHIVIDREYGNFEGWVPILERVRAVDGVLGASPYVAGEVMITSASNLSGAVLRGIDPEQIGNVTDLPRNITVGDIEYLLHPERLLDLDPSEMSGGLLGRSRRPRSAPEPALGESSDAGPMPDGGVLVPPPLHDEATDETTASILSDIDRLLDDLEASDGPPELSGHRPPPPLPDVARGLGVATGSGAPSLAPPAVVREDPLFPGGDPFDSPFGELGVPPPLRQPREVLPGLIVGQELARSLRLHVGDEVNVVSPNGDLGPSGPMPRSRPFRVAAIFYSGMYEYDMTMAYTDLESAQRFLSAGGAVTGIEVKVADWERADRFVPAVQSVLERPELRARSWQEVNRNLFGALALEKLAMFITLGIAILVASFCIIGTLVLMVQEKGREVGILKAMGAPDRTIIAAFMIQGLLIGLVGAITGLGMGWALCFSLENYNLIPLSPEVYYIDHLPVHIDLSEFVSVGVAAIVISLLATIYPAVLGSRLKPVDALRDG